VEAQNYSVFEKSHNALLSRIMKDKTCDPPIINTVPKTVAKSIFHSILPAKNPIASEDMAINTTILPNLPDTIL
jgi:hypothetical protein